MKIDSGRKKKVKKLQQPPVAVTAEPQPVKIMARSKAIKAYTEVSQTIAASRRYLEEN